ncbi:MAG TPA: hypothetical protein V6D14_17130 [Coleofasciculaceae cyanobacterium]|jgi:hypothetical protein
MNHVGKPCEKGTAACQLSSLLARKGTRISLPPLIEDVATFSHLPAVFPLVMGHS